MVWYELEWDCMPQTSQGFWTAAGALGGLVLAVHDINNMLGVDSQLAPHDAHCSP